MSGEIRPAILRTERLLLRPFVETDVDAVFAFANDEEWARYLEPRVPSPYQRSDAEAFVSSTMALVWSEEPTWAVVLDQHVIGAVSITVDAARDTGGFGYNVARPHWGHGYTTEAARAVLDYAFFVLALDAVAARADARNVGSWRVMEKLGMARVALEEGARTDRRGRSSIRCTMRSGGSDGSVSRGGNVDVSPRHCRYSTHDGEQDERTSAPRPYVGDVARRRRLLARPVGRVSLFTQRRR